MRLRILAAALVLTILTFPTVNPAFSQNAMQQALEKMKNDGEYKTLADAKLREYRMCKLLVVIESKEIVIFFKRVESNPQLKETLTKALRTLSAVAAKNPRYKNEPDWSPICLGGGDQIMVLTDGSIIIGVYTSDEKIIEELK